MGVGAAAAPHSAIHGLRQRLASYSTLEVTPPKMPAMGCESVSAHSSGRWQ